MIDKAPQSAQASPTPDWDTSSHENFFNYYEQQSQSPATLERFRLTCDLLLRLLDSTQQAKTLDVLDVGCGAGTQSQFWLQRGHRYRGLDINEPLIRLARERADRDHLNATFDVGTATDLPLPDRSIDVCLLPELLEHVQDWRACVDEAVRVLRPGGLVYINTSSKLCPRQLEFKLPLYSWYPGPLKRYFERRAVTDWPGVANYAKYPAVNWFSYYGLRKYLRPAGFDCLDRFDIIDVAHKGPLPRAVAFALRTFAPLNLLGHIATPYTLLVGRKK